MKVISPCRSGAVITLILISLQAVGVAQQSSDLSFSKEMSKEKKAVLLNTVAGAGIVAWGMFTWDYGKRSPHFRDEGWFERTSNEGGADKLGHCYSGYVLSRLFYYQYNSWGFEKEKSIRLGVFSSIGIMGLMELGDSFSDFGFSYQDMLFDLLGASLGYAMVKYPALSEKIDFRAEYDPFPSGKRKGDVFTDYDRLKFLIALKLSGFKRLKNSSWRYLEAHVGYYARNYDEYDANTSKSDDRHRYLYLGIGLNIGELIRPLWDTKIFDYLQLPYTYVPVKLRLDEHD